MSTPNEDGKERIESPTQGSACCGPGCGCEASAKPGKARWVVGAIVLVAAGVMVVRGVARSDKGSAQAPAAGFANPAAAQSTAVGAGTNLEGAATASETSVARTLGAFAELNTLAIKTDAVFVYLPGKQGASAKAPSTPMKAAARTIEGKGMKCGLFTLKAGSPDYEQVAKQMPVPGVVALVKGRGMSAVSGEVTEAKLLQGYVAASSVGGCSSGSPGCCPK